MPDDRHKEELEILAGRRGDKKRAAVRIADLEGILRVSTNLRSAHAAGASPTAAEFDALVDDVHDIARRLEQVMEALRGRLI